MWVYVPAKPRDAKVYQARPIKCHINLILTLMIKQKHQH